MPSCQLNIHHFVENNLIMKTIWYHERLLITNVPGAHYTDKYEAHKLPSVVTRDLALSHESRLATRNSLSATYHA